MSWSHEARGAGQNEPTDDERELMALLVTGLKDNLVASRMQLSRRTFYRVLRSAMDKLGAQSRIQAGYLAAKRQWIAGDDASD